MNNVPTFEEVMVLTDSISTHHMLNREACEAMYQVLCAIPEGGHVIEVGCDLGRSSSLIHQMAVAKGFLTIHVDPWEIEPEKAWQWMQVMTMKIPHHPFIVLRMKTEQAERLIRCMTPRYGIDMAYIDGCHDEAVVVRDLEIVATRVRTGGFLTAHDYPSGGVTEAIDGFIARGGWTKVNQAGGFGVWRRE